MQRRWYARSGTSRAWCCNIGSPANGSRATTEAGFKRDATRVSLSVFYCGPRRVPHRPRSADRRLCWEAHNNSAWERTDSYFFWETSVFYTGTSSLNNCSLCPLEVIFNYSLL